LGACSDRGRYDNDSTPSKNLTRFETSGYKVTPVDRDGDGYVDGFSVGVSLSGSPVLTGFDRDQDGIMEELGIDENGDYGLDFLFTAQPKTYPNFEYWRDAEEIQDAINKR